MTTNNRVISSLNVSSKDLKDLFETSPVIEAVSIRGKGDIKVMGVDGTNCRAEIGDARFRVPRVNDQSRCYVDILGFSGGDDTLLLGSSSAFNERRHWKTGTIARDNGGRDKVVTYPLFSGNESWRTNGSFVALFGGNRMAIRPNNDEIILDIVRDE